MDNTRLQNLEDQLKRLQSDMEIFSGDFYRNNFSARQDFTKYSNFTTGLKVPHYDSLPSTSDIGELAESGGVLYICSAINTWTKVGLQS